MRRTLFSGLKYYLKSNKLRGRRLSIVCAALLNCTMEFFSMCNVLLSDRPQWVLPVVMSIELAITVSRRGSIGPVVVK